MKRQKPVVREYQDEYFLRQSLILDISTDNLSLVEESVSVATSFLFRMTEKNASVDLVYCGERPTTISGGSSGSGSGGTSSAGGGQGRQIEVLATIQPSAQTFSVLAEHVRNKAQGLTSCVIVSNHWTEEHLQLQRLYESKGVPTTAFIIVAAEDLEHISTHHCHYLTSGKVKEALLLL